MEEEDNAAFKHFLLFPQSSKAIFPRYVKTGYFVVQDYVLNPVSNNKILDMIKFQAKDDKVTHSLMRPS